MGDLNSTPRTWVAGETVTAAYMNTEIRSALSQVQAAWISYATTWSATTTPPTIGNGTLTSRYNRVGKTIDFFIQITMGSTTTYGAGVYTLTLPTAAAYANGSVDGFAIDSSTSNKYKVTSTLATTSSLTLLTIASPAVGIGPLVPFGVSWATGDVLTYSGRYEAA